MASPTSFAKNFAAAIEHPEIRPRTRVSAGKHGTARAHERSSVISPFFKRPGDFSVRVARAAEAHLLLGMSFSTEPLEEKLRMSNELAFEGTVTATVRLVDASTTPSAV